MKTSAVMKSRLVLQDEAVPGESINNLVSGDYESDLPKRIRGTDALFSVPKFLGLCGMAILQQLALVQKILPPYLLHVPAALACRLMGVRAFEFGGT